MFARVLIAVLVLVGQVPLRYCTCGTAHVHAAEQQPTRDTLPDDGVSVSFPEHHHDCQVFNPKPAFDRSLPIPDTNTLNEGQPTDDVALIDARVPTIPDTAHSHPYRPPDPSSVPHHIAFVVLRN